MKNELAGASSIWGGSSSPTGDIQRSSSVLYQRAVLKFPRRVLKRYSLSEVLKLWPPEKPEASRSLRLTVIATGNGCPTRLFPATTSCTIGMKGTVPER